MWNPGRCPVVEVGVKGSADELGASPAETVCICVG